MGRARLSFLAIMASAAMLNGCAAQQQMHWAKPGATQEAFMSDRYACIQQTPQNNAGAYDRALLINCMEAHGYSEDPNGNLVAPPGAIVPTAGPNPLAGLAAAMSPQVAARQNYDHAVANCKACLAANPSNLNACDGLRHIMDADAQILSSPNISQESNVYVGR